MQASRAPHFLTLKNVAFKTADIDFKTTVASTERYLGRARRTLDDSPVQKKVSSLPAHSC